jgi:hypothetical protein
MTRDRKGAPNVYISRNSNHQGESAIHGDGFYTKIGKEGARGTGYTIRFKPDPNAREGEDFKMAGDYLILKNKAALEVIPESFDMSLSEYFEKISHKDFDQADKALVEFVKRRMGRRLERKQNLEEAQKVYQSIKEKMASKALPLRTKERLFQEWLSLPVSEKLTEKEWITDMIKLGNLDREFAVYVLSQPHWKDHPELLKALIDRGRQNGPIAYYVLSKPHWKDHPELVQALIDKGAADRDIASYVLSQEHWKGHPEWVKALIDRGLSDFAISEHVLSKPHWKDHPEWVKALIERGDRSVDWAMARFVLSQPHWKDHPEFVKALLDKGTVDQHVAEHILSQPHWTGHPELVKALIDKETLDGHIASKVLSQPHWKDHPELVKTIIQKKKADWPVSVYVLSQPHWKEHPHFQELLQKHGISGGVNIENLRKAFKAEEEKAKSIKTPSTAPCSEIFPKLGGVQ